MSSYPIAKTDFRLMGEDTPILLLLGAQDGSGTPQAVVPGTLRQLAAALAPLMLLEAVKAEVAKITPERGDLMVLTASAEWMRQNGELLSRFWSDQFPGVALMTLVDGATIENLTPDQHGLRALAEQLRPVLAELDAKETGR